MSPSACVLPFLVFLLLFVQPLQAQTPDPREVKAFAVIPQAHAAGTPILHPALLALQEWDTLRLTPEQVNQLREVQEQTLALLMSMFREQIQDTVLVSAWLFEQEVDEARVRAAVLRKAEKEAELLVQLLGAGRTVTEILSPEQVRLLRDLQSAAVAQRVQALTAEPPARPCTSGGAGGGVRMSPRAEAVYSVFPRRLDAHQRRIRRPRGAQALRCGQAASQTGAAGCVTRVERGKHGDVVHAVR